LYKGILLIEILAVPEPEVKDTVLIVRIFSTDCIPEKAVPKLRDF